MNTDRFVRPWALPFMDTPQPQSPPDVAPLVISDDEVEQLLQQAQTLVDEIAETTTTPPADDALDTEPMTLDSVEAQAEADVEIAVAPVAAIVDEHALDAARAVEATDEIARELPQVLNEAPTASPAADEPAMEQPADEAPSLEDEFSNAVLEEIVEEFESGQMTESPPAEPVESISCDAAPEIADDPAKAEGPTPPEASPAPPAGPASVIPLKARLSSIGRIVLSALTFVPINLANFALRLMLLLDRPFARFSPETKLRVGLVSLVTIFMAAAIWALPRLTAHNPYSELEAPHQAAGTHH